VLDIFSKYKTFVAYTIDDGACDCDSGCKGKVNCFLLALAECGNFPLPAWNEETCHRSYVRFSAYKDHCATALRSAANHVSDKHSDKGLVIIKLDELLGELRTECPFDQDEFLNIVSYMGADRVFNSSLPGW